MPANIVIKIGDIPGESKTKGEKDYSGTIDCLSWHWGLSQATSATGIQGGTSGRTDVHDLTITKYVDKSSPTLIQQCHDAKGQKEAVLTCIKASSGKYLDYIKITMSGTVIISSVTMGELMPNDLFSETVTLNFSHVKFEYNTQTAELGKGSGTNAEFEVGT
jgi:type VI secretion system secreted protein Hcp